MSIADIESALVNAFIGGDFGFDNAIVYENYKPKGFEEKSETYVQLFIVQNPYRVATLGKAGNNEYSGFLQINLFSKFDIGKSWVLHKADEIEAHFSLGSAFSYNGQQVTIKGFGIGPSQRGQIHFFTPLTINYTARVKRKG